MTSLVSIPAPSATRRRATQLAAACAFALCALLGTTNSAFGMSSDDVVVFRTDATSPLTIDVSSMVESDVSVSSFWGNLLVSDPDGVTPGLGCSAVDATTVSCPETSIPSINFYGGAGDDVLTVPAYLIYPVFAWGGYGNDTLMGGDNNDHLYGQEGNDTLVGRAAQDDLRGGIGNDVMSGNVGNDSMRGGAGNDVLRGGVGFDTLLGGRGNDMLRGDGDPAYADVVAGGRGTDRGRIDLGADTTTGVDIWI